MLVFIALLLVIIVVSLQGSGASPSAPPSTPPTLTCTPTAAPTQQIQEWTQWKAKRQKRYDNTEEDDKRFGNFRANLQLADNRNQLEGGKSIHGVTPFSDLSQAEFAARFLTYVKSARSGRLQQQRSLATTSSSSSTPSATQGMIDWSGVYTSPVKDQGYCGGCWAFSAVEQLESDAARVLGRPISASLSTQQVISCDMRSAGCNGGSPLTAYIYLQGIAAESEAIYPYSSGGLSAAAGQCAADATKGTIKVASFYQLSASTAAATEALMAAYVQSTGPLSIAVAASTWNTYVSGVMTVCPASPVNHAVQAVGVDVANGVWKIRNQWGSVWGENGYIRIAYGANACGNTALPTFTAPVSFVSPTPAPSVFRSSTPTPTKTNRNAPFVSPTPRPSLPPVARPTFEPFTWPTIAPVVFTTAPPTSPPVALPTYAPFIWPTKAPSTSRPPSPTALRSASPPVPTKGGG